MSWKQHHLRNLLELRRRKPKTVGWHHYRELRKEILFLLGGKCACCGITEERFLTIDHIKNDGKEHRKKFGTSTGVFTDILRQLKRGEGRDKFQLLCWNCNMSKQYYGKGVVCPLHGLPHI